VRRLPSWLFNQDRLAPHFVEIAFSMTTQCGDLVIAQVRGGGNGGIVQRGGLNQIGGGLAQGSKLARAGRKQQALDEQVARLK